MERRWIGSAVVVAVLVATLVLGRLLGSGLPGTPVAEPPPGPPQVGDCLLDRTAVPFWFVETETPTPSARVAPCTGPRFGEVVAVLPTTADLVDAWHTACPPAIEHYLGLPLPPVGTGGLTWNVAVIDLPMASGPDERQRAAGQDWTACIVATDWAVFEPSTSDAEATFPTTFRDALLDPDLRDTFGYCGTGPIAETLQVPCSDPHSTQFLGFAGIETAADRAAVESSCAAWITAVTGLADPTADGALTVQVTVYDLEGMVTSAPTVLPGWYVDCSLSAAGEKRLAGSLLGLGDSPIPWS